MNVAHENAESHSIRRDSERETQKNEVEFRMKIFCRSRCSDYNHRFYTESGRCAEMRVKTERYIYLYTSYIVCTN